ncbi:unnamed protein product, partial [Polarella glacialis]
MMEVFDASLERFHRHIQESRDAFEAERSENRRRALQLSDQQRRTKRIHDAICKIQSELFCGRPPPRVPKLRCPVAWEAESHPRDLGCALQLPVAALLVGLPVGLPVSGASPRLRSPPPVDELQLEDLLDEYRTATLSEVSCYSPTERVRSSSVSSLASCVIVAPAAHSAPATRVPSKTPPPPGAAREGPCDKDDFSFHGPPEDLGFEAVEAESAANGHEEFPAQLPSSGPWSVTTCEPLTDTDRPVSYAEHVFQLETLLNEVLEAAEFEYEVVRLDSAGDYE